MKDVPVTEDLLSVRFQVKNKKDKDMYIRLCGQTNRLTAKSHEYANHNESFAYTVTFNQEKRQQILFLVQENMRFLIWKHLLEI